MARELKTLDKKSRVVYIGERGGKFADIAKTATVFDERHYIHAGKLRRYHGESWLRRIFDIKTNTLNIRDLFRLTRGVVQARSLFRSLNADAVLLKGGFVCVPVALGAKMARVPMMTHDSDAVPGMSNRIAGRYASFHSTALPAKYYSYPKNTVRFVGLPYDSLLFRSYTAAEQRFLREKYNISSDSTVILVTGGSNGARRINAWVVAALPSLLDKYPKLHVIHLVGSGNESQYDAMHETYRSRIMILPFTSEIHHLLAVSDIVITRAGGSTITELAAMKKASIIIPSPDLAGGHQLKNAAVYEDQNAAIVIQEKQLKNAVEPLQQSVQTLIEDSEYRHMLGVNLNSSLPKTAAARAIAQLLQELA